MTPPKRMFRLRLFVLLSILFTSSISVAEDGSEHEHVLDALRQRLESLKIGATSIELIQAPSDLPGIASRAGETEQLIRPFKPSVTKIIYAFDFTPEGFGYLRVDSESGTRLSKYLRTPSFSTRKAWRDGRSTHAITKRQPDAPPPASAMAFDIRCIGMATFPNLLSPGFTFDTVWEKYSKQDVKIQREGESRWQIELSFANGSVLKKIWLDEKLGMVPVKLAMFRSGSDSPFATVETEWKKLGSVIVPIEVVDWSEESTHTLLFDWHAIGAVPDKKLFILEGFDIAERTLVVDRRLDNAAIIESVLNDNRKPR